MNEQLVNVALIILPFLAESLKRIIPEEARSEEGVKIIIYAGVGALSVAASYAIATLGSVPPVGDINVIWATAGKIFMASIALYDGGKLVKRYLTK